MRASVIHETSAGGVLIRKTDSHCEVCLVLRLRHNRKAWGLPKGHIESGEDAASAALREVEEETGWVGEIMKPLCSIQYKFSKPKEPFGFDKTRHSSKSEKQSPTVPQAKPGRAIVSKNVFFFLMHAVDCSARPRDSEEVLDVKWLLLDKAIESVSYKNERRVLIKAKQHLERIN